MVFINPSSCTNLKAEEIKTPLAHKLIFKNKLCPENTLVLI